METVKVSSKYQVVIPRRIREELGIRPGQSVAVMAKGRALEIVPVRELADSRGLLKGASTDDYRDRKDRV
jgi:AbrB family looped-hinge helix DNA binding protein